MPAATIRRVETMSKHLRMKTVSAVDGKVSTACHVAAAFQ
jgi:hypothetical protein